MAPLLHQDSIRLFSCSADVLDHPNMEGKLVRIVCSDSSRFAASSESRGNNSTHGIVDARQPLSSFRSDIEIIRQIPKLMVDISNRSPTMMDDAKNTTTTTSTTPTCSDIKDKEEKVGQKRNTRISFEAHPFGENKRKTRISAEVHPFLVFDDEFDDESKEQELHMDRVTTTATTS